MGNTRDSIEAGDYGQLAFVVAIEGYENLITDRDDLLDEVVTAWAAHPDYVAAIGGLERPGKITHSIVPFRGEFVKGDLQLVVHADRADSFGIAAFMSDKTGAVLSQITAAIDANDQTISLKDAGGHATSGIGYIGTERFSWGGKSGNDLTTVARGLHVPFGRHAETRYGRPHKITRIDGVDLVQPYVRDFHQTMVGRQIGVWVHLVRGGVVDLLAEAELIYAGVIRDVTDSTQNATILGTVDLMTLVAQSSLLHDQYNAVPAEGIELADGEEILFQELGRNITTDTAFINIETLTVAAGAEIEPGRRTLEEIVDGINEFLSTVHDGLGNLDAKWSCTIGDDSQCKFSAHFTSGDSITVRVVVRLSRTIGGMLGFDIESPTGHSDDPPNDPFFEGPVATAETDPTVSLVGALSVAIAWALPFNDRTLYLDAPNGTWLNQAEQIPEPLKTLLGTSGGDWGFLNWGNFTFLAERTDDYEVKVHYDVKLLAMFQETDPSFAQKVNRYGHIADNASFLRADQEPPSIKQIVLLRGPLDTILTRIFASTGTAGYNHATYDEYDYQLGIGIPWELLGDQFVNTAAALQAQAPEYEMTLIIEEPTELETLIQCELELRGAHLVFRNGGLSFVTPSTPTSETATHVITEADHAAGVEETDADAFLTEVAIDGNLRIDTVKVDFNRDLKGTYHNRVQWSDVAAQTDHGPARALTIEARNTLGLERAFNADPIRSLINDLAADSIAIFSRPLRVGSVPVSPRQLFVYPGDTVALSDDYVRAPASGLRAITAEPCWCLELVQDWERMMGELRLALVGEGADRRATYSPAALVDDGQATDGYDHANKYLYLVANEFSLATEADDGTHFDDGDDCMLIEQSAESPTIHNVELASSYDGANQRFTLASQLPAADSLSGKAWYLVSRTRSNAEATQATHVYLAAEDDGLIVDTDRPFEWGKNPLETDVVDAAVTTGLHEYPPDTEWSTEDYPVTPAMHRAAALSINNFISRKSAPQGPLLLSSPETISATDYVALLLPFHLPVGPNKHPYLTRLLNIGVALERTSGTGTCTIRITSSAHRPNGPDDLVALTFLGIKAQQTWTKNSAGFTNLARQQLGVSLSPGREYTWLTVEGKVTSGTFDFWGLPEMWLGHLETP
jgi:hypothetical protein